jgi:CheY-like chemotaxis protein
MSVKILWADDEIDLLKPHVMFLEEKGFSVLTATNGDDALELAIDESPDIIFLDENMPGLSGLETLDLIKTKRPAVPVVMITKSEEEQIMEEAIGSKISDYLIKPVNPKQILLSIKKNLDTDRLVSQKTTSNYQQEFRQIGMRLNDPLDIDEWMEVYRQMVYWELELESSQDEGMKDVVKMQKEEANAQFSRFIEDNYQYWMRNEDQAPVMSHNLFKRKVKPHFDKKPLFMIVIDNLRFDQWKVLRPVFESLFKIEEESTFLSILPTATHYARNAIFAGLKPLEIQKMFPELWKNENDEGSKNASEDSFLENNLKRLEFKGKSSYNKVTNLRFGKKLAENFSNLMQNDFNVIVYNFVDMLSHARTDMEVIRELADDEAAYRSLTMSWFEHSPLYDIVQQIAENEANLIITTDHGTVRVGTPSKVVGDKNLNTNLRYKVGKNIQYKEKDVLDIERPDEAFLPAQNVASRFIFAKEDKFFAYPNNYNYYVKYYRDTFQHGGISLEEMVVPFILLTPK